MSVTDPPRRFILLCGAALLIALAAAVALWPQREERLEVVRTERVETAPMTPWREPERDMRALFPGSTGYATDILALSGQRVELARRLGRPPAPEENALYLYRVRGNAGSLGTVTVQRVKGEYGAIELVLGTTPGGRVRGVRIQRIREPAPAAAALQAFLPALAGKSAADPLRPGDGLPRVPDAARVSARAVAEGVHSLLILEEVGREHGLSLSGPHAHHAAPGTP